MSDRLTVRFRPVYQSWISAVGGDQADAVRALMVLGAAALGLPGAEHEALRLIEADLPAYIEDALLGVADKRQTNGRQTADIVERTQRQAVEHESDPFANIGIEV